MPTWMITSGIVITVLAAGLLALLLAIHRKESRKRGPSKPQSTNPQPPSTPDPCLMDALDAIDPPQSGEESTYRYAPHHDDGTCLTCSHWDGYSHCKLTKRFVSISSIKQMARQQFRCEIHSPRCTLLK